MEWISVKTRLPEKDEEVTAYHRKEGCLFAWYDEQWQDRDNYYLDDLITHWMPLPEAPE